MTNIIATVVITLITNIASTDNTEYEWVQGPCPDSKPGWSCLVLHYTKGKKISEPTARTDTETIIERRTLKYDFDGRSFEQVLSERQIHCASKTYVLKQQWELAPDAPAASPINHYGGIWFTNLIKNSSVTNLYVSKPSEPSNKKDQ